MLNTFKFLMFMLGLKIYNFSNPNLGKEEYEQGILGFYTNYDETFENKTKVLAYNETHSPDDFFLPDDLLEQNSLENLDSTYDEKVVLLQTESNSNNLIKEKNQELTEKILNCNKIETYTEKISPLCCESNESILTVLNSFCREDFIKILEEYAQDLDNELYKLNNPSICQFKSLKNVNTISQQDIISNNILLKDTQCSENSNSQQNINFTKLVQEHKSSANFIELFQDLIKKNDKPKVIIEKFLEYKKRSLDEENAKKITIKKNYKRKKDERDGVPAFKKQKSIQTQKPRKAEKSTHLLNSDNNKFEKFPRKYVRVRKLNSFKFFNNQIKEKSYYVESKNHSILKHLNDSVFFNNQFFIETVQIKFQKIINFVQEYNNDTEFCKDYKFCEFSDYQDEINKYIGNQDKFKFYKINLDLDKEKFIYFVEIFLKKFVSADNERNFLIENFKHIKDTFQTNYSVHQFRLQNTKMFVEIKFNFGEKDYILFKQEIKIILQTNEKFLKKYLPDIYESYDIISIEYLQNDFELSNYDFYDYLYILFLFKEETNIEKKTLLDSRKKYSNTYKRTEENFFYVFDGLLNIRFYFLRLIFPFIDINIYLNYLELYFIYVFERAIAVKRFCNGNKISFLKNEKMYSLITLFFFVIQKYNIEKNEKDYIREFLLLKFYLCSALTDRKNLQRDFLNLFDAQYMFKNVCALIEKYFKDQKEYFELKKIYNLIFYEDKNVTDVINTRLRSICLEGISTLNSFLVVNFI